MKKSPPSSKKVLVVTGEASGDQLGASLLASLRTLSPSLELHGVGGSRMEALGLDGFLSSGSAHATGFTEVLRHLPEYFRLFHAILGQVRALRPDLIVLVDNPGFNLRLAKKLLPLGIPVIGYVSPQVWAWKEGRVKLMARVYRKVLTLFDFEEDFLEKRGVKAAWVGHPIAEVWPSAPDRPDGEIRTVLLLPGSRPTEVRLLLSTMLEAANRVHSARVEKGLPDLKWVLLEADTLPKTFYDPILAQSPIRIDRRRGNKLETFYAADAAIACSGTVTLECAMAGLPTIIGYRVSAVTAFLVRLILKVKYLGMPNLLAQKEIMPELLQENFTPEKIEQTLQKYLTDPALVLSTRAALSTTRRHLGPPGSPARAAQHILDFLKA
ncbi:MAG: lipid-A-disaccharide synthase [Candidatus Omnitrophica bacterium]|nr:lipid-A-disaccharide synthase [Candidatus Omnitrophota bacterium]